MTGISGIGSEVSIFNLLIIICAIIVKVFGPPWKWGNGRKRNPGDQTQKIRISNPGPPPGQAEECIKHGKKLVEIITLVEGLEKSCEKEFTRINGNIKDLYNKYDEVRK